MSDQPIVASSAPPEVSIPSPFANKPKATYVLLGLNIVTFLLMERAGGSTNSDVLLSFGASYRPYLQQGQYWRLVMPMFLHIGWLHLVMNSVGLFYLGRIVECVYGYGRYALLYVGSGIASSWLSMRLSINVAAGASGAIFGIAGVMLVAGYLHRDAVPRQWRRVFGAGMLPLIVANLLFGFAWRQIDNWGHVGGLAGGMLLAVLIPPPKYGTALGFEEEKPSQAIVFVPLSVVVLAVAATAQHYPSSRAAARLVEEGTRLRESRQTNRAISVFKEAVRLMPIDERPHSELGNIYINEKRLPEAIQEYQEALRLNPDSPRAQLGLAAAYERSGEPAKAQHLFEVVLGKNPETAEGHRILADLCAEQKLYPEAIRHFREALRLNPNFAVAHNNLAWLLATSEDAHYRDPQQALLHARVAVELSQWKQAEYIDTLAEALFATKHYSEAVKVQTRALQLEPHKQEYQEHMARYRKAAGA